MPARKSSFSTIVLCVLFTLVAVPLAHADVGVVKNLQKDYKKKEVEWKSAQSTLAQLQANLSVSERRLSELDGERQQAKTALSDVQKLERDNPSLDLSNAVRDATTRNRNAHTQYDQESANNKRLRSETATAEHDVSATANELNKIAAKIGNEADAVINDELSKRISGMKSSRTVVGYAEVGCGQESLVDCQNRARKAAERDATEKGSVTVVESVTNIENFQLTKDQVKSEVTAQLTNVNILEKGWVNDTSYKYKIEATVTPIVGPNVQEKLRGAIAVELGIEIPPQVSVAAAATSTAVVVSGVGSTPRRSPQSRADAAFAELDRETGRAPGKRDTQASLEQQQVETRAKVEKSSTTVSPQSEAGGSDIDTIKRRSYMTW